MENSENLLKILYKNQLKNHKIVLLQGENGRNFIAKRLKTDGFNICVIECYKRVLKILNGKIEGQKWRKYKINTLVVTSSEILYQLKNIMSDINNQEWLLKCKIFVVGRRLLKIAKQLGWKDIIVSKYANNEYFLKLIEKIYYNN